MCATPKLALGVFFNAENATCSGNSSFSKGLLVLWMVKSRMHSVNPFVLPPSGGP